MKNDIPSYLRTYVPLFVAWLVGLLAEKGIVVSDDISTAAATLLGLIAAALYYAAVKWLEKHKASFGWLLLSTKQPVYIDPTKTPAEQRTDVKIAVKEVAKTPENPVVDFDDPQYTAGQEEQGEQEDEPSSHRGLPEFPA
jgi:hypothetical protein